MKEVDDVREEVWQKLMEIDDTYILYLIFRYIKNITKES